MITKIEQARIVALDGYVEIHIEECLDGVLNIKIINFRPYNVRVGFPEDGGTHFRFVEDYKQAISKAEGRA